MLRCGPGCKKMEGTNVNNHFTKWLTGGEKSDGAKRGIWVEEQFFRLFYDTRD